MTGEKPTADNNDTEERAPVSEEGTPVSEEHAQVPEERAPVLEEQEHAPVSEEHAPVLEKRSPILEERSPVSKEPAPVFGERATVSGQRTAASGERVYGEIERQLMTLISLENQEAAKNVFNDLLRMGRDGYQFAIDLISELSTELTGVKSLQIVPKGPLELDVDMKRKKDLVLRCKYPIAPLVDIHAVTFGEDLNFGAQVDKDRKALKMNIRKGLKLTIKFGPLEQTIDVKGTAMLSRNEKKQLVLSTTTTIPGTDSPITISIPLTMLFQQRKNLI